MADATLPAIAFKNPAIALSGLVDYNMYVNFRGQFNNASSQNLVVIELSTLGGDLEVARMMGEDVRFASDGARDQGDGSVRCRETPQRAKTHRAFLVDHSAPAARLSFPLSGQCLMAAPVAG